MKVEVLVHLLTVRHYGRVRRVEGISCSPSMPATYRYVSELTLLDLVMRPSSFKTVDQGIQTQRIETPYGLSGSLLQ